MKAENWRNQHVQNVLVADSITFYMWSLDMGKCVSVHDISVESTRLLLSTGTIHGRIYCNRCIQLSQRVLLSYQHMRKAHCICFGLFRFLIEIRFCSCAWHEWYFCCLQNATKDWRGRQKSSSQGLWMTIQLQVTAIQNATTLVAGCFWQHLFHKLCHHWLHRSRISLSNATSFFYFSCKSLTMGIFPFIFNKQWTA